MPCFDLTVWLLIKSNSPCAFCLTEDIQCTKCPKGEWSLIRSTNCTEPIFDVLYWDSIEALVIILAVVLLLICQGSVVVIFLKHRGTLMVKASGGVWSFVALLSLMGACLCLLLFLGQPGDVVCRLQLPLTCIFQTVAFSIIMFVSLQVRIQVKLLSIHTKRFYLTFFTFLYGFASLLKSHTVTKSTIKTVMQLSLKMLHNLAKFQLQCVCKINF